MAIPNFLGLAHVSYITAIKNSSVMTGKIKRYLTHLDRADAINRQQPTIGDLPCLEIKPIGPDAGWESNRENGLYYTFQMNLYTGGHTSVVGEGIWPLVLIALYQSLDSTYRIKETSKATITEGFLDGDGPAVTVWEWTQRIQVARFDPKSIA